MSSTEKVIAPCPFCGCEAKAFEYTDMNKPIGRGDYHNIVCTNDDCPADELVISADTPEAAAAKWNRRLSTPAAGEDGVMVFAEHHHVALRSLADKFASGNSVPVDRATILRTEWDAICAFVRDQETIIDDRDDTIEQLQARNAELLHEAEEARRNGGRFVLRAEAAESEAERLRAGIEGLANEWRRRAAITGVSNEEPVYRECAGELKALRIEIDAAMSGGKEVGNG